MIYVKDLVKKDTYLGHKDKIIASSLGDAYLVKNNKIYACRRDLATKQKIKFKKSHDTYNIVPLMCLPEILNTKNIPYYENKNALIKLDLYQKKITAEDLIFLGFKKNYVLHETSHVIMWQAVKENINFKANNELMLAYLLSESYANYTETIANVYINDDIHEIFLSLNSFWSYSKDEALFINKMYKKYGSVATNTTLFLCFLYSNFLYKKLSKNECDNIRLFLDSKLVKMSTPEIKTIFKISSQLNSYFIMKTGEIFWKSIGISTDTFKILDFDPVSYLLKNPLLQQRILDLLALD